MMFSLRLGFVMRRSRHSSLWFERWCFDLACIYHNISPFVRVRVTSGLAWHACSAQPHAICLLAAFMRIAVGMGGSALARACGSAALAAAKTSRCRSGDGVLAVYRGSTTSNGSPGIAVGTGWRRRFLFGKTSSVLHC
jgi:hypothetical protein